MNVAYHAKQLGLRSQMISRIGDDLAGSGLLGLFEQQRVSTRFIQVDPDFSTGTVNVSLTRTERPAMLSCSLQPGILSIPTTPCPIR